MFHVKLCIVILFGYGANSEKKTCSSKEIFFFKLNLFANPNDQDILKPIKLLISIPHGIKYLMFRIVTTFNFIFKTRPNRTKLEV